VSGASGTRIPRLRLRLLWLAPLLLAGAAQAQTCLTAPDMEEPARTALESSAKRYFEMSARGDTQALKANSIPVAAASFAGIENAVKENQPNFTGAKASIRPTFLLTAEGSEPMARAEFLCGVFGKSGQTSNSAVFVLPNLPPGKYAVAILDLSGGKEPCTLTLVMQQLAADWKLAGYYVRAVQTGGHDSSWFTQHARDFKAKGQSHNAWLYYREAIALTAPVDFMSTLSTDKLYDEVQLVQPTDFPVNGNAVDLSASGKTVHWTEVYLLAVGDDLDVVVKYDAADVSDRAKTFEQNTQVIKAVAAKLPELRDAFAGVVARAVDPSGHDFGTLLPMKEIK
jgi:hypothetical protein